MSEQSNDGSKLPAEDWYAENWDDAVLHREVSVRPHRITAERWYADGGYISPSSRYPLLPPEADYIPTEPFPVRDPLAVTLLVLLALFAITAGVFLLL